MNSDTPTEREQIEAQLTALLLGELPAEQAFVLGRSIEQDPELAALYTRLKESIGFVRETVVGEAKQLAAQTEPLKLGAERREKLLAQFKTVVPKEFTPPKRRSSEWFIPASAAAIIIGMALVILSQQGVRKAAYLTPLSSRMAKNEADTSPFFEAQRPEREQSARELQRMPEAITASAEPAYPQAQNGRLEMYSEGASAPAPLIGQSEKRLPARSQPSTIVLPAGGKADSIRQVDLPFQARVNESERTKAVETAQASSSSSPATTSPTASPNGPTDLGSPQNLGEESRYKSQPTADTLQQMFSKDSKRLSDIADLEGNKVASVAGGLGGGGGGGILTVPQVTQASLVPRSFAPVPGEKDGKEIELLRRTKEKIPSLGDLPTLGKSFRADSGSSGKDQFSFELTAGDATLDKPGVPHAATNNFVGRYGYLGVPLNSQTLPNIEGSSNLPLDFSKESAAGQVQASAGRFGGGGGGISMPAYASEQEVFRRRYGLEQRASGGGAYSAPLPSSIPPSDSAGSTIALQTAPVPELSSTAKNSTSADSSSLVVDGRQLFESRGFDEGQAKLKEAADNRALGFDWFLSNQQTGKSPEVVRNSFDYDVDKAPTSDRSVNPKDSLGISASLRGFYNDTSVSDQNGAKPEKMQEYAQAKQKLEELKRFQQLLSLKIAAEYIVTELPKTTMVVIVDRAVPATSEPGIIQKARRAINGGVQSTARIKIEREQSDIVGMTERPLAGSYDPYFIQT
jgi:hypothetical protein